MKNYLDLLMINVFFIQKLVNNNLLKNNHIIILWNVLQAIGFQNSSQVFTNSISCRIFTPDFSSRAIKVSWNRSSYSGSLLVMHWQHSCLWFCSMNLSLKSQSLLIWASQNFNAYFSTFCFQCSHWFPCVSGPWMVYFLQYQE